AARPVPRRPHDPAKGVPMTEPLLTLGGSTVTEHLGGEQTTGGSALMEFRIEPGYPAPPPHVHTDEDGITYVIEGELEITIGVEKRTLGPARRSSSRAASRTRSRSPATKVDRAAAMELMAEYGLRSV